MAVIDPQQPIIAVGDLVWDVLVKPDALLLPGGDVTGQIALTPGGSAANTAAWVARCGMPAGFVGMVGADVFGDLILADLAREGVQLHVARTAARDTGVILALIDRAGQRSMVTNQGADFALMPGDLPQAVIEAAGHVHITAWSLFTDPPRAAAIEAARLAQAAGAVVSFDPASYQMIREIGHDAFDRIVAGLHVDMLFPNRDEGMALTGEREPEAIARALARRFPGAIVALKLDHEGCFVLSDEYARHHRTNPVTVMDTTGAGDAFNAAFIARYRRDGDLDAAARFANAVAGWVVAHYGARPAADDQLTAILAATSYS
ncbi:MAG: sugar kinase [Roseiflexaceae bacterium]|nr:sugar kinase [Roseiflexaceae bacterium]